MIVPFTPTTGDLFSFQATLDGGQYTIGCPWNLAGARWFFNVYTLQGLLIETFPLIGSPDDYDINLVQGYFTASSVVFRESQQQFEVLP